MKEVYYRYDSRYEESGYMDESGDYRTLAGGAVIIQLRKFTVTKKTEKGVWVNNGYGMTKFILDNARKRYAYPTQALAWESFIARKEKQIRILKRQLLCAEICLKQDPPYESHKTEVTYPANPEHWQLTRQ